MRRGSVWPVSGRSRRKFSTIAALAAGLVAFSAPGLRADSGDRTISLYNIHTKETLTSTFKRGGRFDEAELGRISHFMRDWRAEQETSMDRRLVDLLWDLNSELGAKKPIHLISGYRSEQTNEMLRRTRGGQAKTSLHIQGMAADVFFPDVPLERLRNAALVRQRGGVGYYPRSGQPFVHVDTGRVRHWPRIPDEQLAGILGGKGSIGAPASLPEPTRFAAAVFDEAAPPPRSKPVEVLAPAAAEPQPVPIRFASAEESVLDPSPTAPETAVVRHWGQSLLLPSAAQAAEPADVWPPAGGASRVVVTADAASGVKADAPLAAGLAVGYAGLPGDDRRDRVSGLLSSGTGDLARLLAEAQFISGAETSPARAGAAGGPTDLRPAVMIHSRGELPSGADALPPPVMTASLNPAVEPRPARPSLSQILRARLGGPSLAAPSEAPVLGSSQKVLHVLLSAPADTHAMTFTRLAALNPGDVTFTVPSGDFAWRAEVAPRANASAGGGGTGGLLAFAERAIGWIFGN
jgi:uncharacterized protein YcbK (DUF882 family)